MKNARFFKAGAAMAVMLLAAMTAQAATLNLSGTIIEGNTAQTSGGVYAGQNSTINMIGGKIIDNVGGGVTTFTDGSSITITIGGKAVVSGNVNASSAPSNIMLRSGGYIVISEEPPPEEGMKIGISLPDNMYLFVQSGAKADHAQYFFADGQAFGIEYDNGALSLKRNPPVAEDVILDVSLETPREYNGNPQPITITATARGTTNPTYPLHFLGIYWDEGEPDVSYEGTGGTSYTKSATAPTAAGTYAVTLTAPGNITNSLGYGAVTDLLLGELVIKRKPVTITGLSADNKEYDGTTAAVFSGTAELVGVIDGDENDVALVVGDISANFEDANAGDDKTVIFSGYSLSGTAASNYLLSASVTANITKATGSFGTPSALSATWSSTLTLASITPPTNYAWVTPSTSVTAAGNGQSFPATYTDPSGNYTTASGNITVNVAKANQAKPAAPTLSSKTTTTITLAVIAGAEYSRDNGATWQDAVLFESLTPNTPYTFVARLKATANYNASPNSAASAAITTDKAALAGTVTISGSAVYGQTLTAVTSALTSDPDIGALGAFSYQWAYGGQMTEFIPTATGATYTLGGEDIGKVLLVRVNAANATGYIWSVATGAVGKAPNTTPPQDLTRTHETVEGKSDGTISGVTTAMEYKLSTDAEYTDCPDGMIIGLSPGTYHVRYKETSTHKPSDDMLVVIDVGTTSILSNDRVIGINNDNGTAVVIPPVSVTAFEITVGPNPIRKSDGGGINLFATGKRIDKGELTVYDASGNVVRKITISDVGADPRVRPSVGNDNTRRIIGNWDLRDAKNRLVVEGTYLLRGVIKTVDGNRERVSVIIGIR